MKKNNLFVPFLLAIFSLSAYASPQAVNNKYFFLAAAPNAKLIHQKGKHYLLTVRNAPGGVAYFTNRPARKTGLVDIKQFIGMWTNKKIKNNFTVSPPNVALAMLMQDGSKQSFIAEMKKPFIKGSFIAYPLTKISKNTIHAGKTSNTMIFIDDITWNPGGF